MTRNLIALVAAAGFTATLAAAQGTSTPPQNPQNPQEQKQPEVTLTGCLVQGSSPTVFVLENAKMNPQDTKQLGKSYFLTIAPNTEDIDFKANVNKQVSILGMTEEKKAMTPVTPVTPPPAGQKVEEKKVEEKDLPKLAAKAVTMVADRCTAPAR